VVLERLGKVPQILIRSAEGFVDKRSNARHASPHGGSHRLPLPPHPFGLEPLAPPPSLPLAMSEKWVWF
jgi:hypothetical protein